MVTWVWGVDQAREQRGRPQVDHLRAGRDGEAGTGGADPLALDDDDGIPNQTAGRDVEHRRGPDNDHSRGRRRRRWHDGEGKGEEGEHGH